MFQGQTFQPGTLTEDQMRFTGQPVATIARPPGTPAPPRMFTDRLTGKQVTQAEVDSLGGVQTLLAGQESGLPQATGGRIDRSQINQPRQPIKLGGFNPSGMFGRSTIQPQQRGGMFNQQNQFNPQGMQQMMQFMQQMMQMFSMMSEQNRGGGFGGQQQYQKPQRYQPQQYQPPPRQQFQPVQQQYGQMGPQQPSPFAQSIRPRY